MVNEGWHVVWGSTLEAGLMAGTLYLSFRELSRLQFIYFYLASLGMLLGFRAFLRLYYRAAGKGRPGGHSRVLIAGAGELGQKLGQVILDRHADHLRRNSAGLEGAGVYLAGACR